VILVGSDNNKIDNNFKIFRTGLNILTVITGVLK
jgi:hypothetical protein